MISTAVGITTKNYHDQSRSRPLTTEVWYPVAPGTTGTPRPEQAYWKRAPEARDAPLSDRTKKYPLILFSHAYGGNRYGGAWLCDYLSKNGFIVVSVDHYGNTSKDMIPTWCLQPWERAEDLSFVLDHVLKDKFFESVIDKQRIGSAGFSTGGMTVLWLSGAQAKITNPMHELQNVFATIKKLTPNLNENRFDFNQNYLKRANKSYCDQRIKATLSLAPGLGGPDKIFTLESLENIKIPVKIMVGEKDRVTPAKNNASYFAQHIPKSTITILPNVGHATFMNLPTERGKQTLPLFAQDLPQIDRVKIHEHVQKEALEFFNATLT